MRNIRLNIEGMSCGRCVARVRRVLEQIEGVRVTAVEIGSANAEINPDRTDPATVVQAASSISHIAAASAA